MKVTIHDVAKYAGVSIKTVSRVTNNEISVRQSTKDKVNAAIKALNYQPNLASRNLASTKSFVIAFIYVIRLLMMLMLQKILLTALLQYENNTILKKI